MGYHALVLITCVAIHSLLASRAFSLAYDAFNAALDFVGYLNGPVGWVVAIGWPVPLVLIVIAVGVSGLPATSVGVVTWLLRNLLGDRFQKPLQIPTAVAALALFAAAYICQEQSWPSILPGETASVQVQYASGPPVALHLLAAISSIASAVLFRYIAIRGLNAFHRRKG